MRGHWWGRALAFLGLLAGAGLIAAIAYNAGTMHAVELPPGGMGPGGPAGMYGGAHGMAWGGHGGFFGGFILFRVLFGLFFLFLLLRVASFAIFGPRHWGRGWAGGHSMHERRQAMFEDWHREAHAASPSTPTAPATPDTTPGEHEPPRE